MPLSTRHTRRSRNHRVLIVDGHEISRAAHAALLRTEGLDVFDIGPYDDALALARALRPQLVVIDAPPAAGGVGMLARALRTLPCAPAVVLTSSDPGERLDPDLAAWPFVAKADLCAAAILRAITACTDAPPRELGPE